MGVAVVGRLAKLSQHLQYQHRSGCYFGCPWHSQDVLNKARMFEKERIGEHNIFDDFSDLLAVFRRFGGKCFWKNVWLAAPGSWPGPPAIHIVEKPPAAHYFKSIGHPFFQKRQKSGGKDIPINQSNLLIIILGPIS